MRKRLQIIVGLSHKNCRALHLLLQGGYRIWLAAWRWQRARRLLHLSPRAGRGRFASGALAKRSKSGEGACPQAEARGTPPHPDSFAALGIRPLPARGERWRKWLCLAPQDTNSNAIALLQRGIGAPERRSCGRAIGRTLACVRDTPKDVCETSPCPLRSGHSPCGAHCGCSDIIRVVVPGGRPS